MTITYTIELHDIAELTWPMWDACGIECPVMIGGLCPRDARDSKTNTWLRCPGWSAKFPNAASEVVHFWTLDSGQSEECGNSVDGDAWFGLFRNPDAGTHDGPMGAGVVICEISSGAVQVTRFATTEELDRDWAKIVAEYGENEEDDYEDEGCEGHVNTDDALTSGVGIGEAVYCDGSCNPDRSN